MEVNALVFFQLHFLLSHFCAWTRVCQDILVAPLIYSESHATPDDFRCRYTFNGLLTVLYFAFSFFLATFSFALFSSFCILGFRQKMCFFVLRYVISGDYAFYRLSQPKTDKYGARTFHMQLI